MHFAIDQHVNWIARCIDDMKSGGHTAIDAEMNAATEWVGFVSRVAEQTWPDADSWYLGANIPGKPRIFLPLVGCECLALGVLLGQNACSSVDWMEAGWNCAIVDRLVILSIESITRRGQCTACDCHVFLHHSS